MSSLRALMVVGGIVLSLVVLGCRPHSPGGEPASATVVAPQRTKQQWAQFIRQLADEHYPTAEKIVLVMDNLTFITMACHHP